MTFSGFAAGGSGASRQQWRQSWSWCRWPRRRPSRRPPQAGTVITFDDLAAGWQLTTQYAADGVTFGVAAPGQGVSATMDVFADASAFSPPNDAGVGGCGEACQANMWAEFSSPQQQVSVFLDNEGVNGTVSSAVNAYDGSGNLVASTPFTAQPNIVAASRRQRPGRLHHLCRGRQLGGRG